MSWVIFSSGCNRHLHEHGEKLLLRDTVIIASTVAGGVSQTASNNSGHAKRLWFKMFSILWTLIMKKLQKEQKFHIKCSS